MVDAAAEKTIDTRVHFELLEQADRIEGIAKLLLRRNRLEPAVLILCPDPAFMAGLDERLWTIHPESFLAHGVAGEDEAYNAEQPILLATEIVRDNSPKVLINGCLEVPIDLSGFEHIVDFVDGWDDGLKQAARERFRTYQQLEMNPKYLGEKSNKATQD